MELMVAKSSRLNGGYFITHDLPFSFKYNRDIAIANMLNIDWELCSHYFNICGAYTCETYIDKYYFKSEKAAENMLELLEPYIIMWKLTGE